MTADLTSAAWVLQVDRESMVRELGVLTVMRAEGYVDEGHVTTLVAGPGGGMLLATVRGSAGQTYQTIVRRLDATSPDWVGQCSCPVTVDCKHAVATIMAARRRLEVAGRDDARATWETMLSGLVRPRPGAATPTHPAPPEEKKPLGLQFSIDRHPVHLRSGTMVRMRPVTPGRSKPWVRTGVTWRDLSSQWSSPAVRPQQRMAVNQLHLVVRGAGGYYNYAAEELVLGELGSVAWTLLRQCVDKGVELVPGSGLSEVVLGEGTARLSLDLTRDDDGGLTLRPWLTVAHPPTSPGRHFMIGTPVHGVGHLDEEGKLTLWELAEAPPDAAVPLLEADEPVRIPPPDVDRFLTLYYPTITRLVSLGSFDGSVPEAAASRPTLLLRLTPSPGHLLELEWMLRYAVPTVSGEPAFMTMPLNPSPDDPARDESVVDELLDDVVDVLQSIPSLLDRSVGPWQGLRPYTPVTLVGQHTARFVDEVVPALRAKGVEVEVTGDEPLPDYSQAEDAPEVHLTMTQGAAQDWFDLNIRVTVAGQDVPFEPLFAALARGDGMMLLESGTYFSLDQPELHRLRELIQEAREIEDRPPRDGVVGLTPMQAGLWEELVQLGVVDDQSEHWQRTVQALLDLGDADRGTIHPPQGLTATLRPYQLEGFQWLSTLWDAGLGGILADDMGLGKTLQTLSLIGRAEQRGDLADGPVLVVAPTSVIGTWVDEAAQFLPDLRVTAVTATRKRRGQELTEAIGGADVVVTSYTLLRLEADVYAELPWSAVVLDEAQFVKNYRSATYRAVRGLSARRTFVMTGTPLENTLMDLWSMTSLAAPGLFARPEDFHERYRKPIDEGDEVALARLRRRVRPFMMRRTKGEVATELPEKTEQTLRVSLHPTHQRIYDQHLQRERQRVLGLLDDMDKHRMAIFRALTTLRQLALDPSLVFAEHADLATPAKITALIEQITELAAEGHRALVFSSFTSFLGRVREALEAKGIGYSYLDGSTRNREACIRGFKEGDDPVFLISLKAGGFGLTLTEADYVFVLDPWWNPAAEAQAVDRTHRIGQTQPVNVYRFVSTGTIEEKVVALQQRKRELFSTVVDAGRFRSGAITAEDIRGLLDG